MLSVTVDEKDHQFCMHAYKSVQFLYMNVIIIIMNVFTNLGMSAACCITTMNHQVQAHMDKQQMM